MKPLTTVLAIITATPVSMPGIGPVSTAAEIVALVAHNVVGHDWLSSAHWSDATNSVDSTSAITTTISANTHAALRPNPCRYATAQAELHPISTVNNSHPAAGWSSSELIATWKPSA